MVRAFKVQKGKFKGFAFLVSGDWLRIKSEELRVNTCQCLNMVDRLFAVSCGGAWHSAAEQPACE
jgi:hypothetical protein